MKVPVFRFQDERLTDAPMALIRERLAGPNPPLCLKACPGLRPMEVFGEELVLRWHRTYPGAREEGTLRVRAHERGAYLSLQGRLGGWSAFWLAGWMRWRTDRLLERIVEEL